MTNAGKRNYATGCDFPAPRYWRGIPRVSLRASVGRVSRPVPLRLLSGLFVLEGTVSARERRSDCDNYIGRSEQCRKTRRNALTPPVPARLPATRSIAASTVRTQATQRRLRATAAMQVAVSAK